MTEEVLDMYNGDTLIPVRSSPLKQSERPSKIAHIAPKIRTPVLLRMICWGSSEDATDAERGHTQSAATRFKNVKTNIHTKICNMMQHVCTWPENARGQAQPSKIEKPYLNKSIRNRESFDNNNRAWGRLKPFRTLPRNEDQQKRLSAVLDEWTPRSRHEYGSF